MFLINLEMPKCYEKIAQNSVLIHSHLIFLIVHLGK